MNLEDGISKKDWIEVVQFINFRWDNAKIDETKIKEFYPDFARFPEEVVWKSMNMYYENGNTFFNVVDFRKLCMEQYQEYCKEIDNKKLLTMGETISKDKGGLLEYLKLNGYESFAHAVWDVTMKRIRSGRALPTDDTETWDTEEDWTSAKPLWLQHFKTEWSVEQLERNRELANEDKPKKPKDRKRSVYSGD